MREIKNKFICTICNTTLVHGIEYFHTDEYSILCPRCGNYLLSGSLFSILQDNDNEDDYWRWLLSYFIRNHYDGKNKVSLDTDKYNNIINNESLPNPIQQSEHLLEYLGKNIRYPSDHIILNANNLAAIIGAKNVEGVHYISEYLQNTDHIYYKIPGQGDNNRYFGLTIFGWNEYNKIIQGKSSYNLAFMAMEYNNPLLDEIYYKHIKPTLKDIGFEIRRLDEIPKAGLIDNHLRAEIKKSKLILSDLSFENNGAYWESGYSEGLGKPVIYLCQKELFEKFKTHFDTNHHTTIIWDKDNIPKAMENLKATILNTFSGY